ncbi:MAG: o-succinylbenzoate--CoA ligase [Chloroflexota bacterium]|nr:MAG: o-succinylbenzoate--CoA ligase [Chloroflexota bacterium]
MQDWLAQRAMRSPERVALFFRDAQWTWRELDARVNHVAAQLDARGISQNTRVAVLMQNSDAYVVLVHALARIGAVLVPINTRLTANEIEWQLNHVHARFLIYDNANSATAAQATQSISELRPISLDELQSLTFPPNTKQSFNRKSKIENRKSEISNLQSPVSNLDSPHAILFTSGTTGKSKGAMLTYANHWWNAMGSALNLGLHDDDVWLLCMPLFHIGGLAIVLRSVIYGNPVVLHEAFDAGAVNRAFDEQRVTIVSLVSTMLRRVLDARGEKPFPETLRAILLGGGPAPKDLLERCAEKNVPVVQTYGLTEAASQVATLAPSDALRKLGSAGKPLFGVELKIEHDARDKVGEILIRGATVMQEYAEDAQATQRAFRGGWFHTGDLGYLDDEGYLYVLARRNDLIVSGGENIYPAEIENVLNAHPAILEAVVIGAQDAEWGQTPVAYCVVREKISANADELKMYCAEKLARYKIPSEFVFVENLPRNASGKILRRELAEQWTRMNVDERGITNYKTRARINPEANNSA